MLRPHVGRDRACVSFAVRVTFVDNTYWDDGSRWTTRWHKFDSLGEAVNFRLLLVGRGHYETTSRVTGETSSFSVCEDDVAIFRVDGDGMRSQITVNGGNDVVSYLGAVVPPTCSECGFTLVREGACLRCDSSDGRSS